MGVHTVRVSDAHGCSKSTTFTIASASFNNLQAVITQVRKPTCSAYGKIRAQGTGGTAPYSYSWGIFSPPSSDYTTPTYTTGTHDYWVTVTDGNGCTNSKKIVVASDSVLMPPVPTFTLSSNYFYCNRDSVTITVANGQPYYNYQWDQRSLSSTTRRSVVVGPYLNGYNPYNVLVDNGVYCQVFGIVGVANPTSFANSFTLNYIEPDHCSPTLNTGYIHYRMDPEAHPGITAQWSSSTNQPYSLTSGWYSVTLTLPNCGTIHHNHYVPSDCQATVAGYVVKDNNNNCMNDAGDIAMSYDGYVRLRNTQTQQIYEVHLDNNGFYTANVNTGTYQITYIPNPTTCTQYTASCGSANGITLQATTVGAYYSNQNFYRQAISAVYPEMSVNAEQETARPIFPRQFVLNYKNKSIETATNATITLTHDSRWANLTMLNGGIAPVSSTATSKTWNVGTLMQNTNQNLAFTMELPANIPIGIPLANSVSISASETDCTLNDNTYAWTVQTTNAFDPNDKTLLNAQDQNGNILNDNAPLRYQIRFQNTGSDVAYDVVVRDTINLTHLDKTTFKTIAASHNMQATWIANNVIEFRFPNINLVDSLHNEPLSHGWLQFSITPKANTPLYSIVRNSAAIFFDYNTPIITNTVQTQFVPFLGVDMVLEPYPNMVLQVTPNPTTGSVAIYTPETNYTLTVTDITGRSVAQNVGEVQNLPDVSGHKITTITLPNTSGIYFITIKNEHGSITKKIVKI